MYVSEGLNRVVKCFQSQTGDKDILSYNGGITRHPTQFRYEHAYYFDFELTFPSTLQEED